MTRRFDVPLGQAFARQAVEREQLLARMRAEEARTRLGLHHDYHGVWRRWTWSVVDESTGKTLAAGRALTERGMRRRRYAAYLRELDRLKEGQAES